ncbi:MAG: ATP-binding protein [Anaerolineales bacterium]
MPMDRDALLQLQASLEAVLERPTPQTQAAFRDCLHAMQTADLDTTLHAVQRALRRGQPPPLPASLAQREAWQALLAEIHTLQKFVLALGKGDLEQSLPLRGLMAGGLKALQANLRHLTWQTQQIAKGDFDQHVDFMGEFSSAFNKMVTALKESQANLQRRERELSRINADLRREIVERKKIETQIRESEARYRLLTENMADVVWVMETATMTFSYVSPSVKKLRGYTSKEVLQQSIEQVITPDSLAYIEADLPRRIERFLQGDPDAVTQIDDIEQWRKDGSTVWTEVSTTLILTPAGIIDVIGVSRDITERRRIEQQIREANENLRRHVSELSTLNRITQAIATQTRLEEVVSIVIRETVQLFDAETGAVGLLDEERQGQTLLAIYNRHADGPPQEPIYIPLANDAPARRVIASGEPLIIDLRADPMNEINRRLAAQYHIKFNMTTPLWARGEVIGTYSMARHESAPPYTTEDAKLAQTIAGQIAGAITNTQYLDKLRRARDAAEEARQAAEEARRAAEKANQAKSTFLANMSHELRTPMNAVLGFAELMAADANLTKTQRENLAIIQRSGDHLLALINDVLDLSKIEAGQMEIRPTVFDLHLMLQGLSEMFSLRAEKKGLTLTFDLAPDVPRRIRADEGKLRQVLINLLANAVKFTKKGSVTVKANHNQTAHAEATVLLHVEIADTGVGIAPEEMAQVFETFVQTESGRQAQTGTGLGLPISREYVRMMGGELTVTSEVGVGSTFQFDIPITVISAETAPSHRRRRVVGLAEGQSTPKILIAEDQNASQQLLHKLLAPVGFEVQIATDGAEAIARWQTWRPDLILMDIRMPEQDGLAVARQIRARPGGAETVIVAVTASGFKEDRAAILAEGCDDFLRKPYREADIFDIIARHLNVSYLYEPRPDRPAKDARALDFTASDLPDNWRADLQQATIEGDLAWMHDLAAQIHADHPAFAEQLLQWINNFQHDEILALCERIEQSRQGQLSEAPQ